MRVFKINRTRFRGSRRKAGTRQGALARSLRCSLCIPLDIRHLETRNKLGRVKDLWDRYYLRAGQLLVNFFFVPSNIPRNLCESLLAPSFRAVSKVANGELARTGYPNYGTCFTLTQSEYFQVDGSEWGKSNECTESCYRLGTKPNVASARLRRHCTQHGSPKPNYRIPPTGIWSCL